MRRRALFVTLTLTVLASEAPALAASGVDAPKLAPAARGALSARIDADKAAHPAAFARVAALEARVLDLDAKRRGPLPVVKSLFQGSGPDDVYALLELAAFGPEGDDLPLSAWRALRAGALETLGRLRDPRAEPGLEAIVLGAETDEVVLGAAAEALGRLGTDGALATLRRALQGAPEKRLAALRGLAASHRPAAAEELARFASKPADIGTRLATIRALGEVGSAWAFEASVVAARGEGAVVRRVAARALVAALLRERGELEIEAMDALLVVAAPETRDLLLAARKGVDGDKQRAIDATLARL